MAIVVLADSIAQVVALLAILYVFNRDSIRHATNAVESVFVETAPDQAAE